MGDPTTDELTARLRRCEARVAQLEDWRRMEARTTSHRLPSIPAVLSTGQRMVLFTAVMVALCIGVGFWSSRPRG